MVATIRDSIHPFGATMILGGTLMLPQTGRTVRLSRGLVEIASGTIKSIRETENLDQADLGGEDWLICPGFTDTHVHLPQFDSIGVDGLELLEWLDKVIFPAETRWEDPDYAGAMTERVLDQFAAFGTTSFAAYATVHHRATLNAIQAIAKRGVKAIIGQVLMDRNAPQELTRPAKQLIAEASSLKPQGRVEIAVTPRFAISCSDALLAQAGQLAQQTGSAVQTHLSETKPECKLIAELFPGTPYTEVYQRAGLLGPKTILGHGIWLDNNERATLAKAQAIVAHCPTANLFLDAGTMDRIGLHNAQVRTTLGSDIAGGPDRSMVRVARAMIETAKHRGDPPPLASEAWWQITTGNSEALGWSSSGRLQSGSDADLLLINPNIDWLTTPDPLGTLLYAWDDRWLQHTMIAGKLVFQTPVQTST